MQISQQQHAVFFRLSSGDALPDALVARLREAGIATGTLRAHGVLEHVELRTFHSQTRTFGSARSISGAVHAITIDGTIGLSEGTPQVVLRAVLSRETDASVETLSGVIASARVVALEVVATSAQDLALPLVHDARAGLPMLADSGNAAPSPSPQHAPTIREDSPRPAPTTTSAPAASGGWADAVATSNAQPPLKPLGSQNLPAKPPARPVTTSYEGDQIFPEPGDLVQHFAFGSSEVLRSDGDRLHLKVGKDGRIREIALEMLKVTFTGEDPNVRPRHFKLDRKL
jgi:predicted DNA-binding protein with PD1-like motif